MTKRVVVVINRTFGVRYPPAHVSRLVRRDRNLLKGGELANRCCQDLDELRWELGLAIRRY